MSARTSGRRALAAIAVLLAVTPWTPLAGQCGLDVVQEGIRAYQNLRLARAVDLLSRAIAEQKKDAARCSPQERALAFLGAADFYRGDTASARETFRELVMIDPRFEPDTSVFPPEITSLYDEIRLSTPVVLLDAPARADLRVGLDSMTVRLFATSRRPVAVVLEDTSGARAATLYRGPARDSMNVGWAGRVGRDRAVPPGSYVLTAVAADSTRPLVHANRVPLSITYPGGVPAAALRGSRSRWHVFLPFAEALAAGGAAVALPHLVGGVGRGGGYRWVVAVALTAAGGVQLVDGLRGVEGGSAGWPHVRVERRPTAPTPPGGGGGGGP